MFFVKKVFLIIGLFLLFSLGGAGTQSNSLIMQGMGFFGLIIGLIILYVFGKMVWKGIGCLPSFLILSAIVLFIMYSLGFFNNGIGGVGDAIFRFIGREKQIENTLMPISDNTAEMSQSREQVEKGNVKADFSAPHIDGGNVEPEASPMLYEVKQESKENEKAVSQEKDKGLLENVISSFAGGKSQGRQKAFNPNDYPVVYGSVRVVNADTFIMYGSYFKLFGIDAPESNQTCADKRGRSYHCGREAALWLKNWIGDAELECHVVQQDTKGNMVGTCSYGQYDLGAVLVNAGWAVADTKYTQIYYPYELQAQENRRGLWQGQFYKPWDWRKMQSRTAKIKVVTNKKKKNMFGI